MADDEFNLATSYAKTIIGQLKSSQVLRLYGLYKQATVGDNDSPKPSWYNLTDKQKWEAWTAEKGKKPDDAKMEYVKIITKEDPDWLEKVGDGEGKSDGWVHHSCLLDSDAPISDEDKTIFDWVKENDVQRLKEAVSNGIPLDRADEDGLTVLHWAADRGHVGILQVLLGAKVDLNTQDREGQTPLHYASSCGHSEVVRILLNAGADPNIADHDGETPKCVASSETIASLFST